MDATRRALRSVTLVTGGLLLLVPALGGCAAGPDRAPAPSAPRAIPFGALTGAGIAAPAGPGRSTDPQSRPAGAPTLASATAHLRYFWSAYSYAYASFDTVPLDSVSYPGCRVCAEVREDVRALEAAGTRVTGYETRVEPAGQAPVGSATAGRLVLTSTVTRQPGQAVGPRGERTELPGFTLRSTTTLVYERGHWYVQALTTRPV